MKLILASTSPRRKELLGLLGLPFDVVAPSFVEQVKPGVPVEQLVREFAVQKARSCTGVPADAVIIGSDTLSGLGTEALGKPDDLADAAAMLRRMAGRTHTIHTALALICRKPEFCDVSTETVCVTMKAFGADELQRYLDSQESLGKAGAYSIQGRGGSLIERIEGDYTAAVGLPVRLVADMLRRRGIACPVDVDRLYRERPYPNWERFQ